MQFSILLRCDLMNNQFVVVVVVVMNTTQLPLPGLKPRLLDPESSLLITIT